MNCGLYSCSHPKVSAMGTFADRCKQSVFVIFSLVLSFSAAHARCDVAHYVFQDQDGNEAVVKDVRECFRLWDLERNIELNRPHTCYTERQGNHALSALNDPEGRDRVLGTRLTTILYKGKEINIADVLSDAVPPNDMEVDPDLSSLDPPLSAFKKPAKIYWPSYELDFTGSFEWQEKSYKELYGKRFVFKRCQA